MRMSEKFKQNLDRALDNQRVRTNKLRDLEDSDIDSWREANRVRMADARSSYKPGDVDSVRALIRNVNPIRWRRLNKDVAWARREMEKAGLNPEDVIWLL